MLCRLTLDLSTIATDAVHPGRKVQLSVARVGAIESQAVGLASQGQISVAGVVGEYVVVRWVSYIVEGGIC